MDFCGSKPACSSAEPSWTHHPCWEHGPKDASAHDSCVPGFFMSVTLWGRHCSDVFSVLAEGCALWLCVVPFGVCQVTFLWVTVRCYKSLVGLCVAANTEGENPLPSVHTSVSDMAVVEIAAVIFFKKSPSVQLPGFSLPLLHPQRAGLKNQNT